MHLEYYGAHFTSYVTKKSNNSRRKYNSLHIKSCGNAKICCYNLRAQAWN